MIINYETEDKSIKLDIVFLSKNRLKYYRGNKTYPKVTQCIIMFNGLIHSFGQVRKCESDNDDPIKAMKLSLAKALEPLSIKFIRKDIWDLFHLKVMTTENENLFTELIFIDPDGII